MEQDRSNDIVVITKHSKIIHKIFTKMSTLIKSVYATLNETNYSLILTKTMRELNKESLFGFQKRDIAVCIMVLLLDSLGCPDVISRFTAEVTMDLIENIYTHNMHRFKHEKRCVIL